MSTGTKTLRIYWSYWQRRPWLTFGTFLLGPTYVFQSVLTPLFIAKAIGQISSGDPVSASYIWLAILSFFGGITVWYFIDSRIGARLDLLTMRDMYSDCFDHLHKQEYSFFVDNFGGSLVSQANRFVKAYELFHITFFVEAMSLFSAVTVSLIVMIVYNVGIGLAVALLWCLSIAVIVYLAVKRMSIRRMAVAQETAQTGELADSVTNAITLKTFATNDYELEHYNTANTKRHNLFRQSWKIGMRNHYWVQILCGVFQTVLLVAGIRAIQNGSLSIATFLLFQVYGVQIIQSLMQASLFVRRLEGVLGDSHEMTELLGRKPLIQDPEVPEKSIINKGEVKFKNVQFDYNESSNDNTLFNNLNITVHAGERVGLIGPSGGGKTTITRLLLRFHDINSGEITIDDQNITAISQSDLHRQIAYVPQDPILFHRSLAENIAYGNPSATQAMIKAAAQRAHADEFIQSLPQGYNTLVGERGIKLSGGQRQRVAIARAMLKDAPILLLDEATSALDSESEKLIQSALWELMKKRTALVIAHRLSTIQRMDRIIVLDEGKIVEEGSHAELLAKKGLYARLWAHQSGGFLEE
ncbi:MAG: ABC transporter ATP-binding protein [Patescibacteria group bacterium]